MSGYHTVEQGEYLASIALRSGFAKHATIWDHPENADLKKRRQYSNVLFPGDRLFIPDKVSKEAFVRTDRSHRFVLGGDRLRLRIVVADIFEKPVANAACELSIGTKTFSLVTDDHGKLETDIRPGVKDVFLTINSPETAIGTVRIPIKIGHLDPVDEVSGQRERLNNLGYFAGPLEGNSADEDLALLLSAIEEFQCDHALVVDGKCGPATQAKLKQAHGS